MISYRLALALSIVLIALAGCGDDSTDGDGNGGGTSAGSSAGTSSGDDAQQADRDSGGTGTQQEGAGQESGGSGGAPLDADGARPDRRPPGLEIESGSDEEKIANTIDGLYDDLSAGRVKSFCRRMSLEARRQMAREVRGDSGVEVVCEQAWGPAFDAAQDRRKDSVDRTVTAEISAIGVKGNRGTATVRFRGGTERVIPMVRERGTWRLASVPTTR